MARSSIGLDIGTRAVSLAEVAIVGGRPTLNRFGRGLLPAGAVEHGEINDPQAVSEAITALWKKLGLTGKAVHVGVANRHVVVRVIELPAMSKDDLKSAIRFQAQDHIPIPLSEAVMDYEVLDEIERPEGNVQHVLVVAAERGALQPLLTALQTAHLEPRSIELNAYPLVRCFGDNGTSGAQAIVDVGAGVTNVVVQKGGKIRFTRILPTFGGEEFTKAIMERLGLPRDEAEQLKRRASPLLRTHGRVSAPAHVSTRSTIRANVPVIAQDDAIDESDEPNEIAETSEIDPDSVAELIGEAPPPAAPANQIEAAAEAIDPVLDRFVTEVRGSLDFYSAQPESVELESVVVTGGGSLMGGIAERLSASLGIHVDHGHPFERVPVGKVQVSPEEMSVAEPFMGVAIGLALAGAGS